MFWKKKRAHRPTTTPGGEAPRPKARLDVESLEKRVLLSASWVDADTGESQSGATDGNDAVTGTAGADVLDAGAGDDLLSGNGGDDLLAGGTGNDTIDGGAGNDTVDYSGAAGPVSVDITLDGQSQDVGADGTDTLTSIEAVKGSTHNDTFAFSEPTDGASYTVDGNGGSNTIDLSGVDASDAVVGSGRIVVQTDAATFEIDYANVDSVTFADGPIETPEPDAIDLNEPMHRWHFTESGAVDLAGDSGGSLEGDTAASGDGSASFDGSDHAVLEHTDDMLLDEGTVHLRFNADSVDGTQGLLSKDSTDFDDGGHLTMWVKNGEIEVRIQSTSESITLRSDVGLQAGEWHDVSFSFGDEGAQLFVNGELADTDSYTGGLGTTSGGTGNSEPIVIGANAWKSSDNGSDNLKHHFTGEIEDVAIFGEQLDAEAVEAISPPPPVPTAADLGLPDSAATEAEIAGRGPVAHWSFADGGVTDKAGNANGTFQGDSAAADTDGRAAKFDGSGDYVVIEHDAALELNEGSIELRFNADDAGDKQGLFSKDSSGYDDGGHVTMWVNNNRVEVRVQSDDASYMLRSDAVVNSGEWTDVALHFGEDGLRLVVNGEVEDTDPYTGGLGSSSGGAGNTEPIVIGANQWSSGDGVANNLKEYFAGQIADVAVYGPEPEISPDDVFDLTASVAGDAHTIDGGDGSDTIDLSTFGTDDVTFADGQLTVATGDGGSFTVDYQNVETITFADGTATVVGGDMTDVSVDSGDILIDGDVAVQIEMSGGGDVVLSHAAGELGFEIESSADTLVLESLGRGDAMFDIVNTNENSEITVRGDAGGIDLGSEHFRGTLQIEGDAESITTGRDIKGDVSVSGDVGALSVGDDITDGAAVVIGGDVQTIAITENIHQNGSLTVGGHAGEITLGGDLQAGSSLTVGSAGSVSLGDDVIGTFDAEGDVDVLTVADDVYNGGVVAIGGGVGRLEIGDLVRTGGTVTIGGFAEAVSIGNDVQTGTTLSFGRSEVIEVGGDVAGTMTVGAGTVDTIELGGTLTDAANITIGGDLNDFTASSMESGTSVVVENASGPTTFSENSGSQTVTLDEPTRIEYDGDRVITPNAAPVDLSLSGGTVPENAASGTVVGSVGVSDPDSGDTFSYALIDDAGGRFEINSVGDIVVADGASLDHESAGTHSVTVEVTDSAGHTIVESFDIAVSDINESPLAGDDAGVEGGQILVEEDFSQGVDGWGGDASAGDGAMYIGKDGTASKAFDFGAEHANQTVVVEFDLTTDGTWDTSGSLEDRFNVVINGETLASDTFAGTGKTAHYQFEVQTDENGQVSVELNPDTTGSDEGVFVDSFQITSGETWQESITTLEDTPITFDAGTLLANDADADGDALTITSVQDAEHGSVALNDDGSITFTPDADYNGPASFAYTVEDGNGGADTATVSIDITAVNDAPTGLEFAGGSVAENAPAGTVVATASAGDVDADGGLAYSLTDDAGGRFVIDATSGEITTTGVLDHEGAESHTLRVVATDAEGLTSEADLTVAVGDVNDGPTIASPAVVVAGEGETVAMAVDAADQDGDALTYTWTQTGGPSVTLDGADSASPTVTTPDVGGDTTLTFEVAVSDGEFTSTETVTVEVQANEAPAIDVDSTVTVREGEPVTLEATARPSGQIGFDSVTLDSHGGAGQDVAVDVTTEGDTLRMEGNGWKSIDFPYEVTEDTVLEFQFRSTAEGELHGVGFDNDGSVNPGSMFKVMGTQDWGNQAYAGDATDDGEWVTYRIPVGEHFTGDFDRLVFMNDHDVASPTAVSEFRGVQVYEAGDSTGIDSDLTYEWTQVGGPAVTLDDPTSTTPTFDAPDLGEDQTITFEVTVSDGDNATTETVEVRVVANVGPTVNAGGDIAVDERGTVTLSAVIETPEPETLDFGTSDISEYGGSGQNTELEVAADGDTLELTGNGWRAIPMDATIEPDTVLEFQFRSDATGEIHGVAFDTDNGISADRTFQLSGTQDWGIQAEHSYEGNEGEWVTYRIPVGEHFTGDFDRIVFVNDHDVADADANSQFRGLRLTNTADDGTPAVDSDISYSWEQISGPAVTLSDPAAANPTFEAPEVGESSEIQFRVTASDGDNATTDVVTVQVNPVNDAPTGLGFVGGSVGEDAPAGTVVATASATDPDANETLSYSLVDDAGGAFAIDADTGEIVTTGELDHETASSHTVTVRAVDAEGLSVERDLTVTVGDVNESPVGLGFVGGSVGEDALAGTIVATASATDPDANDTLSYSLVDDAGGAFAIDADTGEIVTTGGLDHETASSHTVTVRAVDGDGLSIERDLTVTVGDVNESPVGLGFVGGSVSEDAPAGTVVATASATDPDANDTLSYSLVDDAGGAFAIDADTGEIVTTGGLDHETASSHTVTVRAVDGDGLSVERDLTVTVGDVNESPVGLGFVGGSVGEDAPAGTVVATASATDPDAGDALSYSLVDDADGAFAIDASTGEIVTRGGLDHETASSHTVTVRAVDGDGLSVERDLTVTVGDVNESPEIVSDTAQSAVQGEPVTLRVSVDDPDGDAVHFSWRQTAGPPVELSDTEASSPTFVAPGLDVPQNAVFEVTVSDGEHTRTESVSVLIEAGDPGRARAAGFGESPSEPAAEGSDHPAGQSRAVSLPVGGVDTDHAEVGEQPIDVDHRVEIADEGEAIEWVTREVQEIAQIADSIESSDVQVGEEMLAANDGSAFEAVFESADDELFEPVEPVGGEAAAAEPGEQGSEPNSGSFMAKFVALMRAGFGAHQRDEDEDGSVNDRFKR